MNKIKAFFSQKKTKRALINIGIIALVLACIILLNAIITIVANKFNWFADMTDEKIYTASDALKTTLRNNFNTEEAKNVQIDIIFCCDEDYAKKNYANLESGQALAYVHKTATEIDREFDNITVKYRDPKKEPEFFRDNFTEIDRYLSNVNTPVIVAKRNAEGKYGTQFTTYPAQMFYVGDQNGNLYAYNGEKVLASAILSLSYNQAPTVYFTLGHNETLDGTATNGKTQLEALFLSCGFKVGTIDLSTSSVPDDCVMLIINEPKTDFDSIETNKLELYLSNKDKNAGNLMVFIDPDYNNTGKELKTLTSFLEARTGIIVNTKDKVSDSTTNIIGDKNSFKGTIANTTASSVYLAYYKNSAEAKPFFTNSGTLTIKSEFEDDSENNDGVYELDGFIKTQAIYTTTDDAYYNDVKTKHVVMAMSAITNYKNDNETVARVLVCPSGGFASDEALLNNAYPNSDILYSIIHTISAAQVPVDIDMMTFMNYDLNITEEQAKTTTLLLVALIPVISLACGAFVIYRRKSR